MIAKLFKVLGWIVLALTFLFWVEIEMQSQNPCSVWAKHPNECSSNHYPNIK